MIQVLERLTNIIINLLKNQIGQNKKLKAEQPLNDFDYLKTLFWFLIEESNELTGLDFLNRFEIIADKEINKENLNRRTIGLPPFTPRHPNIITAIEYSDVNFIMQMFLQHFVKFDRTKPYDCVISYKLNGEEKSNLTNIQDIKETFQINYMQSRAYNPIAMITCNQVIIDGSFLRFHLIHYGKWNGEIKSSEELEMDDSSFKTITILKDYINKKEVSINLKEIPHYLVCGESGSGKTYFSSYIAAKLCQTSPESELYILDYKGDESLTQFKEHSRYFYYKKCQIGLEEVYSRFSKRLEGTEPVNNHIICYFDELASYINSFEKKAIREDQQRMIAEILMMGRSKKVNFITSTQRPDAQLFALGSRMNYSFKFLMGGSCSDPHARKMIFDTSEIDFKPCKQGSGYFSINGSIPELGTMPIINNIENMYKLLHEALER